MSPRTSRGGSSLNREPDELTSVEAWRLAELIDAGWPLEHADVLAARNDVDLHVACDLLRRGCSVETALLILL